MSPRLRFLAGPLLMLAIVRAADEPPVTLPPMIVMEAAQTPPWYYLNTPIGEYLSRCTPATTREFVAADMRQLQLLRVFVPDQFILKMDKPALLVLDRPELKSANDQVMQDMRKIAQDQHAAQTTKDLVEQPQGRIEYLLNLRIDDRDMHALFAYVDEKKFDGDRMVFTSNYVRYLLERRQPDLPAWFIEGAVGVFEQASFSGTPIAVRPAIWQSFAESTRLQRYADWPRTLLPMNELLAPSALRAPGDRDPERVEVWRAQAMLFFRWASDSANGDVRAGYWRLVEHATQGPIDEATFEECFGFGFAEMRDRLSDYLSVAVREPLRIEGRLERMRPGEPQKAPRELVARLLGDWERLEISHVRAAHPEFAGEYANEARRTLHKAYDAGDRDPQLLASLGLCEIDAGNPDGAPFFLNRAVTAKVVRPRAYYEVARMRYADLFRNQSPNYLLTPEETEMVVGPLRTGLAQLPVLPDALTLFAATWARSAGTPPASDFATLELAARLFPARPGVLYSCALMQARFGRFDAAREMIGRALRFPLEEQLRARLVQLQTAVDKSAK